MRVYSFLALALVGGALLRLPRIELSRDLRPTVLERDGAIEPQAAIGGVLWIAAKIPHPLKLDRLSNRKFSERRFNADIVEDFAARRVEMLKKVLFSRGVFGLEEAIVEPRLGAHAMDRAHPMERPSNASPILRSASNRVFIHGAFESDDLSGIIPNDLLTADDARPAKADLTPRSEAEEFFRGILHEIIALDEDLTSENKLPRSSRGVFGIFGELHFEALILAKLVDDHLEATKHGHPTVCRSVQLLSNFVLEQPDIDHPIAPRDTDAIAEISDRRRRDPAPPHPSEGRHPRIVPAVDMPALDEDRETALAQDRIAKVQPRELDLTRRRLDADHLEEAFIQRPVVLEFQAAKRMRHPFDGIALPVRPIVHRVDAPLGSRSMVGDLADPVHERIAELQILALHVDLGAEHMLALIEFTGTHAAKEVEVFFGSAIAIGARDALS